MNIIWTIIIGFVIGLIARALMPGKDVGGFVITAVLGIAGAALGHLIGRTLGLYPEGGAGGLILSVIGAIVLLIGYRYVTPLTSTGRA